MTSPAVTAVRTAATDIVAMWSMTVRTTCSLATRRVSPVTTDRPSIRTPLTTIMPMTAVRLRALQIAVGVPVRVPARVLVRPAFAADVTSAHSPHNCTAL